MTGAAADESRGGAHGGPRWFRPADGLGARRQPARRLAPVDGSAAAIPGYCGAAHRRLFVVPRTWAGAGAAAAEPGEPAAPPARPTLPRVRPAASVRRAPHGQALPADGPHAGRRRRHAGEAAAGRDGGEEPGASSLSWDKSGISQDRTGIRTGAGRAALHGNVLPGLPVEAVRDPLGRDPPAPAALPRVGDALPACPYLFYLERHLEEHIRLDHKELLVCGTVRYEVALINPARRTTRLLARPPARQRDKERAPRRRPAAAENKRCPPARWGPAAPTKKHKHAGARTHHPAPPLGPARP